VPRGVNAGSGGAADTGGPVDSGLLLVVLGALGATGAGAVWLRRRRAS
jgi:LPXTG-motif cell wall-anchored protein